MMMLLKLWLRGELKGVSSSGNVSLESERLQDAACVQTNYLSWCVVQEALQRVVRLEA